MSTLKRHELSSMFPDMPADDFKRLVADIRKNGLIDPITVWKGEIIDGWHRYRACAAAGVEPRFVEFEGDDRRALALVVSKNARRRHLPEAAIASITKKVLGWHKNAAMRGGDRRKGAAAPLITQRELAEASGLSIDTIKRHTEIEKKAPALMAMAERGEIGLATAVKVVQTIDAEVLGRATPEEIRTLAAAVGDRLDSRIAAMRRAAREVRSQWAVLSRLSDTQALAACSEVWLILSGLRRVGGEA